MSIATSTRPSELSARDCIGLTVAEVMRLRGHAMGIAFTQLEWRGARYQPVSIDIDEKTILVFRDEHRDWTKHLPVESMVVAPWKVPDPSKRAANWSDTEPVERYCVIHGSYWQTELNRKTEPVSCPGCAVDMIDADTNYTDLLDNQQSIRSREGWIDEARRVHGDKYDYDSVHVWKSRARVTVLCREHGAFLTFAGHHVRGAGKCPTCRFLDQRVDREEFERRAIEIHGDRYDLSQVEEFANVREHIIVGCPDHGEWSTTVGSFINDRHGCLKCKHANSRSTSEEFWEKVRANHPVHGYDLSRVEFVAMREPIDVICREHGLFRPTAHSFAKGQGCIACGKENAVRIKAFRRTRKWIEKAIATHEGKYSYPFTQVPTNARYTQETVEVLCPNHRPFRVRPSRHLKGDGCPSCPPTT